LDGVRIDLGPGDLVVDSRGPERYYAESDGRLIVAVDARLTEELLAEGFARELVNRVQNQRKQMGLEVTDRIRLVVKTTKDLAAVLATHAERVKDDTLAVEFEAQAVETEPEDGWNADLNGRPAAIVIERMAV
jgi:isoleucyl-tRNA synthetase